MHYGKAETKAIFQPIYELRGQTDFRYQQQALAADFELL